MNDEVDLLQIKIERAKQALPPETLVAINSVDWKGFIAGLRDRKGFSIEQIGDLELETELLLAGMTNPDNYPAELTSRLNIPRAKVDELINEMNEGIFKPIREQLIKGSGKIEKVKNPIIVPKKEIRLNVTPSSPTITKNDTSVLQNAGIQVLQKTEEKKIDQPMEKREDMLAIVEKPELELVKAIDKTPSLSEAKLGGTFKMPSVKTEYSLGNISKTDAPDAGNVKQDIPSADPYRMPIEEK